MSVLLSGSGSLWLLAILLIAAVWMLSRSKQLRAETRLPDGEVIYSDNETWFANHHVLHAENLRLVGKPDYLVEADDGTLIPVELKSGFAPASLREGHVLQLAAYCLLVEENYGTRPSYGILQYRDKAFAVDYSPDLEADLHDLLAEMRATMRENVRSRNHDDPAKCAGCGVRMHCNESLV